MLLALAVLAASHFQAYVERFNRVYPEEVVNAIPDARAYEWMREQIPYFTCPDTAVEETYYYRWWAFRKHIKSTPGGFVFTEFLKRVNHASDHNAISCAFGHHVAEGRWLHDARYIDDYARFWLQSGEGGGLQRHFHQFSGWAAHALYERYLVNHERGYVLGLLDALVGDYAAWERERLTPSGLSWQRDVSDGMEESASGGRRLRNLRPTINSYMYGNATAIAELARMAGRQDLAREYTRKAAALRRLILDRMWNPRDAFFETLLESGAFANVRELIGYTPWMFGLAQPRHDGAWKQLADPQGFQAPFGPTTAERRSPLFQIAESGDDCQWNGPSWPFSTTITLKALANYGDTALYYDTFQTYTRSQRLNGEPFIDENLNPLSGEWWARHRKLVKKTFYGRGDHYNHSGYADLLISGLIGLRPRADDVVEVRPLLPEGRWDWFCLDHIRYHGRDLTILWDRDGKRFGRGAGLSIYADGRLIARSKALGRLTGRLRR